MPVREPIGVYPLRTVLTTGGIGQPWLGMRDARETTAQQPDKVLLAQNLYLAKGGGGRAYVGRPGFTPMGAAFPANVQWCESWYRPSGVVVSLCVAGGALYRYDWTTSAWVLSVAQATTGLATTGRVQFIPFAGGLVINDRVNRPRYWDGTDGGGITVLTNAPVAWWGWVQSAKLVFINAANRLEIQWSEEAQPNTGYAAGGFNNAWELRQLGNAPLTAGIGRNGGMVVFRERSTFTILGEITTDFQSASTRSDVSDVIGTLSPWALCATDQGIVFLDSDARPFLLPNGGQPEPLWPDCVEQLSAQLVPRNQLLRAITLEDRAVGELLIGLPSTTSSEITKWLAFDRDTLTFEGVWPIAADHAGMVVTDANEPRWVHTSGTTAYLHGAPGIGVWSDFLRVGGTTVETAIPHALEGPALGRDLTESLFVDTIEVGLSASQVTRVTVTGETPDGVLPALDASLSVSGGARLGAFRLTVDRLGTISRDRRVMVGQDGYGRWVRPILRHSERGEPISITDMRVVVFKDDAFPDTV
jgi:hypothetical protein